MKKLLLMVTVLLLMFSIMQNVSAATVTNDIVYIDLGSVKTPNTYTMYGTGANVDYNNWYLNPSNGQWQGGIGGSELSPTTATFYINARYLKFTSDTSNPLKRLVIKDVSNNVLFDSDINNYLTYDPSNGQTPSPPPTPTPTPTVTPKPTVTPIPTPTPTPVFALSSTVPQNHALIAESGTIQIVYNKNLMNSNVSGTHIATYSNSGKIITVKTNAVDGDTIDLHVFATDVDNQSLTNDFTFTASKESIIGKIDLTAFTTWIDQLVQKLKGDAQVVIVTILVLIALVVGALWLIGLGKRGIKKGN